MKKKLFSAVQRYLLATLVLLTISCRKDDEQITTTNPTQLTNYDYSIQWTGYRSNDLNSPSAGTIGLKELNIKNGGKIVEALKDASFKLDLESFASYDSAPTRDSNVKSTLFNSLMNIEGIIKQFDSNTKKATIELTIGGVKKDIVFDYITESSDEKISIGGYIDLIEQFNATTAMNALKAVCPHAMPPKIRLFVKVWPKGQDAPKQYADNFDYELKWTGYRDNPSAPTEKLAVSGTLRLNKFIVQSSDTNLVGALNDAYFEIDKKSLTSQSPGGQNPGRDNNIITYLLEAGEIGGLNIGGSFGQFNTQNNTVSISIFVGARRVSKTFNYEMTNNEIKITGSIDLKDDFGVPNALMSLQNNSPHNVTYSDVDLNIRVWKK
ncbi:hypothetical protein [Chryseobacterium potabilaquae]|uniref:Lipid/polyisoprenoid-binding YceI-like domain-containing protein n=1 Tax=Chryseobacterium potabilaquae TaxID=2675057 RepID=A0A6N4X9K5_9FLAO|nr:hypothetical protein [Chryseobacterium potabilaquae]CAA7195115.1 hypothetical protein CHRY9293_01360 [Chryseobacterium potabilaquae]